MAATSPQSESPHNVAFQTTHWSVVLAAADAKSPDAEEAMARLCASYWFPVYAFVRRRGHTPEEAEDLTQSFFQRLLAKELLCACKPDGARFRAFLIHTVDCFLKNQWHYQHAQKRGGGQPIICLDEGVEQRYACELADQLSPEMVFDRQWAFTLLDRVFSRLSEEHCSQGKRELFEQLQAFLPGGTSTGSYGEAARQLDMNEAAVRMAVHRLRRRYGDLLRAEIAETVSTPSEIDAEIRYLVAVIGEG